MANWIVGVDATRNRSGGAVAHVRGLFTGDDPRRYGISRVHLWAHDRLLEAVAGAPWLEKHSVPATRGSILRQMAWQRFRLPRAARQRGVDAMFNTDAGSVCPFQPSATLSQDMLSFEPGEIRRYPWPGRERLRLELLRVIQLHRLRRSAIALFLSEHAREVIGREAPLVHAKVIPHGIDTRFFGATPRRAPWPVTGPINCLYVSNAAPYKHQWHVVEALALLRERSGRDFRLRLVGGGRGAALDRLRASVTTHDPDGRFVQLENFLPSDAVLDELAKADMFIYASTCENLPITLLEAMAAGLPIASSLRGPMPEVLGRNATYFDPEDPLSIAEGVERIVTDENLRHEIASGAHAAAEKYTWQRYAELTWRALASIASERRA